MDSSPAIMKKARWSPVCPKSLSHVEFSPTAIADYAYKFSADKRPDASLALRVRKQLLHLDWKIESMPCHSSFRYRYTSPDDGKKYLSLHLLCDDLSNNQIQGHPRKRKKREDYELSDSLSSEVISVVDSEDEGKSCKKLKKEEKSNLSIRIRDANSWNRTRYSMLSSSTDNNLVMEGEKVHYRVAKTKNRPALTGRITHEGIECDCCQKIFSLTEFEAHSGSTNHRPAANIILEDGRSLSDSQQQLVVEGKKLKLKLKITSKTEGKTLKLKITRKPYTTKKKKKKHSEKEEDSDYLCSVCLQGGDLILCDGCPSAFHKICLGIKDVPFGKWFCPFCCCDYCGCRKFKNNAKKDGYILRCEQCSRKIHVCCAEEIGIMNLKKGNSNWFCNDKCKDVYFGLQNLLGKPIAVGADNLTWTLLKGRETDSFENYKLNLALEAMHECFKPVEEFYTGRDLVEDVIFSKESDLNRLNFRRFYTILLERNNEVISVANLRIYGDEVAELPLVATRFQYRRLGMCKKLMDELEKQLIHLGVKKLVLPSAYNTLETWTDAFGFSEMTESNRRHCLDYNFLNFQGTVMCHKPLRKMQ